MYSITFDYFHQFIVPIITILGNWIASSSSAVAPPPWANPLLNPCAALPRGWLLIQWRADGQCYKIFQKGFPCPDDMELSPDYSSLGQTQQLKASCKCPPETLQSSRDGKCYDIFTAGPCDKGQYFALDVQRMFEHRTKWGICLSVQNCTNMNQLFWPKDGACYDRFTRGPCPKGQLLSVDEHGLAACKCNNKAEMFNYYYAPKLGCFAHFTKGPCKENGQLFLPNRQCDCHKLLPHFHHATKSCYELGSIGPCSIGEVFDLDSSGKRGVCDCKKGHIRYAGNMNCYRPFTQGPCESEHILVNQTHCVPQPCARNFLYFPADKKCYRIGTLGPCQRGEVVSFDFNTRPSVDGISYNGLCVCANASQSICRKIKRKNESEEVDSVQFREKCYKLYT